MPLTVAEIKNALAGTNVYLAMQAKGISFVVDNSKYTSRVVSNESIEFSEESVIRRVNGGMSRAEAIRSIVCHEMGHIYAERFDMAASSEVTSARRAMHIAANEVTNKLYSDANLREYWGGLRSLEATSYFAQAVYFPTECKITSPSGDDITTQIKSVLNSFNVNWSNPDYVSYATKREAINRIASVFDEAVGNASNSEILSAAKKEMNVYRGGKTGAHDVAFDSIWAIDLPVFVIGQNGQYISVQEENVDAWYRAQLAQVGVAPDATNYTIDLVDSDPTDSYSGLDAWSVTFDSIPSGYVSAMEQIFSRYDAWSSTAWGLADYNDFIRRTSIHYTQEHLVDPGSPGEPMESSVFMGNTNSLTGALVQSMANFQVASAGADIRGAREVLPEKYVAASELF